MLRKVSVKKTFSQIIGIPEPILGFIVYLVILFVIIPLSNEDHLLHKLDPSFERFKGITVETHPNKSLREAALAEVLTEKTRVTDASTYPFITCTTTYTTRNSETVHRYDARDISCSWGS